MNPIPINTINSPTVILELIYRLKIKDVMSTPLVTADKSASLRSIQLLMRDKNVTGIPIVQGKRLLGLVSMDDIIQALDLGYIEEKAEKHMTRNLTVLEDDMPVSFAITYFDTYPYHRFPVLSKKKELVGMVTTRDISARLLLEINREVDAIEQAAAEKHVAHDDSIVKKQTFTVLRHNFENAGYASTELKKFLKSENIDTAAIRRAAVASYELEINLVVHSEGGTITSEYGDNKLKLTVTDTGPGIPDIDAAMEEGFSTANSWIRSLGFGAGMGLPNVKRVSDEFSINSEVGKGTAIVAVIYLSKKKENSP
jgi:CBS domain-containing protein